MEQIRDIAVGWHADPNDPTTTRYWNGTRWTIQRRWGGTEWVDVPLASLPAPAAPRPRRLRPSSPRRRRQSMASPAASRLR